MNKTAKPKSPAPAEKYRLVSDSQGGLVLTPEFMRNNKVQLGDEYAAWKTSKGVMVVFKKNHRGKRRIPKHAIFGKVQLALPEIIAEVPKPAKTVWNSIPETLTDGWTFGSYTRYAGPEGCCEGDGFVIAPDGQRAELDWQVGKGKLKRTSRSDERIWGVFEVGFPRPVTGKADLIENFRAVLPQIKAAFARHEKRRRSGSATLLKSNAGK
jgi:hypothetical protein